MHNSRGILLLPQLSLPTLLLLTISYISQIWRLLDAQPVPELVDVRLHLLLPVNIDDLLRPQAVLERQGPYTSQNRFRSAALSVVTLKTLIPVMGSTVLANSKALSATSPSRTTGRPVSAW